MGSTETIKGPGLVYGRVQDQLRHWSWDIEMGLEDREQLQSWAPHHGIAG